MHHLLKPTFFKAALTSLITFTLSLACTAHADWPNWRGPDGSGTITTGNYPEVLGEDTIQWKQELPGKGCSTPIIFDQKIYLTAPTKGHDSLIALTNDGKKLWSTSFGIENPGKHRNGSGSNASPTADSSGVYVYYKSGTLAAVNFDGTIRWQKNLVSQFGEDTLFWDHGTSPVLTEQAVIMTRMHHGESWIAAFDKESGEQTWKTDRNFSTPTEGDHGYTTPLIISFNQKESILTWGAEHLTIHDANSGEQTWLCGNFNPDKNKLWPAIATPVIIDDVAVICFGRNDRGLPQTHGIKISGTDDVTATNHAWQRDDISSFVPSPIAYKGSVYLVRDRGEVECIDPKTGKNNWNASFPKARSNFYATPMIAAGNLYAAREDGVVYVAKVSDQGMELLSENEMQQPVIGTPVPMNGRLLIRGENELLCFGLE